MSHDYSAYDPSIHEELKKINWDAVLPSVLKYAVWRTKKFGWLGEKVDPEALGRKGDGHNKLVTFKSVYMMAN